MAKRPERSEADESAAPQAPKKDRRRVPRGPTTVQQAPGDAIAARSDTTDRRTPTEEEIRARAYQMYLERGGGHGMDFDDWLRAERELKTNG